MGRNAVPGKPGFRRWLLSWTTVTRSLLPDGSRPRKFIKLIVGRGPGGRGGMVSFAGRRLRPLPRAAFILTVTTRLRIVGVRLQRGSEARQSAHLAADIDKRGESQSAAGSQQAGRACSADRIRVREDRAVSGVERRGHCQEAQVFAALRVRAGSRRRAGRTRHKRTLLRC